MTPTEDRITIPATLHRPAGRAWRLDLDAIYAARGITRAQGSDVAQWIIEASWAHPLWHSYWLVLTHLRPIEGVPEAKLYLPDATHEIVLFAMNADHPRQAAIETGNVQRLEPANFAAQFVENNDEVAAQRIQTVVSMICNGHLSPDTDFRRVWIGLFGDNMIRS